MSEQNGDTPPLGEEFTFTFHVLLPDGEAAVTWVQRVSYLLHHLGLMTDEDGCNGHMHNEVDIGGWVIINIDRLELASNDVYGTPESAERALVEMEQTTDEELCVYGLMPEEVMPMGDLVGL